MKYIMLIPDGMADLPLAELGGETPMQAAHLAEKHSTLLLSEEVPNDDYD